MQEASVKYIIVPYDSQREIFLKERKYDEKQYKQAIEEMQNISWLKRIDGFGKIAIFEVPDPRDHFWSPQENLKVQYQYINPTKYILNVENAKKGDILIFSEFISFSLIKVLFELLVIVRQALKLLCTRPLLLIPNRQDYAL